MIDLDKAKAHLRVDFDTEDALIQGCLDFAIDAIERACGRFIVRKQAVQYFDGFVCELSMHHDPVWSIDAVDYIDADGVAASLDVDPLNGELRLVEGEPFIILPPVGGIWPATESGTRVKVTYTAGYHDLALADNDPDQLAVPGSLDAAVLMMVGHLYENREAVVLGTIATELPLGVQSFIWPFRRILI